MRKNGWKWLGALLAIVLGVAFGLFAGVTLVRAQSQSPGASPPSGVTVLTVSMACAPPGRRLLSRENRTP